MNNRLIGRTLGFLNKNFKGVSIIRRETAYDKMAEVIPFAEITINKIDDSVDEVIMNFGTTRCHYHFVWGESLLKPKQRLNCVVPIKEAILVNDDWQDKP